MTDAQSNDPADPPLLAFELASDFTFNFTFSAPLVVGVLVGLVVLWFLIPWISNRQGFEVDSAEFGLDKPKITLKPNSTDRQIAYQVWIELSTRKIGLPIDLEHDVISEVYDSWYSFFSITRELLKDVPVRKFRRKDTAKIIDLTIDVLNEGLRPHLTKWQARYRRWYEPAFKNEKHQDLAPQDVQKEYPSYDELTAELLEVNKRLMAYREKMKELIR